MTVSQQNENMTDLNGNADPRALKLVSIGNTSIEIEVMIYRQVLGSLRPLVIVSSIDLPMPPSCEFCEQMWQAGYQVICIRRPGFGRTADLPSILLDSREVKNLAPVGAETVLLRLLVDSMGLKDLVLMGLGTSNSICFRLAQICPEIALSIYANPLFHPAIWDVIRPAWLRRMIRQTLLSKSGLKIAMSGLRAVLRRDPIWFYKQFAQKSPGDVAYVAKNLKDFEQAGLYLQRISPETMYYELQTALIEDVHWQASVTRASNAVILSGAETTRNWKREITKEADRLGLPIVFAPAGDLFVPYVSPETLRSILEGRLRDSETADAKTLSL